MCGFTSPQLQAREVLESALAQDATITDAVLALARLDVEERKYTDAITRYLCLFLATAA